jgi:hypothetical protein
MPWFPDFVAAAEMARREIQDAGRSDPVGQYLSALDRGDARDLQTVWPGHVVVRDPRAGTIRGHRQLRRFIGESHELLAKRHARTETVASTCVSGRVVVELLARLAHDDGDVLWPVAVVAEAVDEASVEFRTYCSQWPVDGRRHVRGPILGPGLLHPGDVVGRYLDALMAGDVDAIVNTFEIAGYLREATGSDALHRGSAELRAYFAACFDAGGGIALERCGVTDDGVRCALEYNCVRWGSHDLPPQAGIVVFERGPNGRLAAVRIYDDVEPPAVPT